jgi:hypothetical protein
VGDWVEKEITLEPGSDKFTASPLLKFRVKIEQQNPGAFAGLLSEQTVVKTRAVEVEIETTEFECHFHWGSYSSSKYSTSFSGYTNEKGTIKSLSDFHTSEEERHHHIEPSSSSSSSGKKKKVTVTTKVEVVEKEEVAPAPPPEPEPVPAPEPVKPKKLDGKPFLKGVILGASSLIRADSDGTDSYVTVTEVGKKDKKGKKPQKSVLIHDTEHPRWNFAFDLGEVTKGGTIEFSVFQSHKFLGDAPIGYATKEISTIEVESPVQVEIPLQKPNKFKKIGKISDFVNWGSLQVVFDYHFE